MQCRECHQALSPAEVLRHAEHERAFEDFERGLRQWNPAGLEDVEIPDHPPADVDRLTMLEDGILAYPTSWAQPTCDRCIVLGQLESVLYGEDAYEAYNLMQHYRDGTCGCPKNPVMAVSWALVAQQYFRDDDDADHTCGDCQYCDAGGLIARLTPQLTVAERDAAHALAADVYAIAREHGVLWVPEPAPESLALFQKYFGGAS